MTFQQLQYLLEVYRAGSVSQAAKNLFVGQSSVSVSISSLEKELGYQVFDRSKKGVVPTPRGKAVIEHAARICESYRLITGPERSGNTVVRISCGGFGAARRAVVRLMEENKDNREVCFHLVSTNITKMMDELSMFELDLGLCFVFAPRSNTVQARAEGKGLRWVELGEFPAAVCLSERHPLYYREKITLKDLEQDRLLDTADGSMSASPYFNTVMHLAADRVIRVSNAKLREELLEQGVGYAVRPVTDPENKKLRRIPLEQVKFKLVMMHNPLRTMRPEVQRYVELLKEALAGKENLT